jgi:hypothetical protein
MTRKVYDPSTRKRYVNPQERAEIASLRAIMDRMTEEATREAEAMPAPCMERWERFGAVCPDRDGCGSSGLCARDCRRRRVIMTAHLSVRALYA